jgi:hypothetical protein
MAKQVLINVILDRSGSMSSLTSDVIGHYNGYIDSLKEDVGVETRVSLVLFDEHYTNVYTNLRVEEVPKLDGSVYYARGSTALLDAIGRTITTVAALKEKPENIVFVINTDGYENASREYSKSKIKELIDTYQDELNWQFVFIGAGIDAIAEGGALGLRYYNTYSTTADSAGLSDGYATLTQSSFNYRSTVGAGGQSASFNMVEAAEEVKNTKTKTTAKNKKDKATSEGSR